MNLGGPGGTPYFFPHYLAAAGPLIPLMTLLKNERLSNMDLGKQDL